MYECHLESPEKWPPQQRQVFFLFSFKSCAYVGLYSCGGAVEEHSPPHFHFIVTISQSTAEYILGSAHLGEGWPREALATVPKEGEAKGTVSTEKDCQSERRPEPRCCRFMSVPITRRRDCRAHSIFQRRLGRQTGGKRPSVLHCRYRRAWEKQRRVSQSCRSGHCLVRLRQSFPLSLARTFASLGPRILYATPSAMGVACFQSSVRRSMMASKSEVLASVSGLVHS